MGNKDSTFSGQGKVLGTGEVVNPPKRSSILSKLPVPSSNKPAVSNAPSIQKKNASKATLSESEKEVRRKAAAAAAEAREKAWDERIARQRTRREAEGKTDAVPSRAWNEVSPPPSLPPLDPETMRKQKEAAAALEKSGFNPYAATVASSSAARSVIVNSTIGNNSTNSPNADPSIEILQSARAQLKAAMRNTDALSLQFAIQEAEEYGVPEVEEARLLLATLTENQLDDEMYSDQDLHFQDLLHAIQAFHVTKDEPEKKASAAQILQTLLRNLLDHPENPKFRKIRLDNKAIKEKLLDTANGTGISILLSVGFERTIDDEGQSCLIVPDPETLPTEIVAHARKACELALSKIR